MEGSKSPLCWELVPGEGRELIPHKSFFCLQAKRKKEQFAGSI